MNPFGLKTLLKTSVKTLVNGRNFALEILVENTNSNGIYIAPLKFCPLAADKGKFALPVDRPTVKKVTVEPSGRPPGRPPGRPCQIQRAIALWPVDRPVDRAKAYGRPSGRPSPPESGVTSAGRPHGRPAKTLGLCARIVHIGRPFWSTGSWSGRPVGRPPEPGRQFLRI